MYVNDAVADITSHICLFADDTSLYLWVEEPEGASNVLNHDLYKLDTWSKKWLVKFSAPKTKSILFSRNDIPVAHPSPLSLGVTQTEDVTMHKHLGLHFNKEGNWSNHIDATVTKANTALNILWKLKYVMDRGSLLTLYTTQIRPIIMEYADCAWINLLQYQKDRLEELQLEAMQIITGAPRVTHHAKLYTEVGFQSHWKKRKDHQLDLYYKMANNLAPPYLSLTGQHTSTPTTWTQYKKQWQSLSLDNIHCFLPELICSISNHNLDGNSNLQRKTQVPCSIYPQILPHKQEI